MASTLALGDSGYQLLDLDGEPSSNARVSSRTRRDVDQAVVTARGALDDFSIGGNEGAQSVSVSGLTTNLFASLGQGSDTLSLRGTAESAQILLDDSPERAGYVPSLSGNDQFTASSLTGNSYVWAGGGDDTIRVTGSADGALFDLGDGNDVLRVSGSSAGLNVAAGAGDDSLQFNGGVGSADGSTSRIDAGAGNDTVVINGGVVNTDVFLGLGNDSLVVRGGGEAFGVDADVGSDTIALSGDFTDAYLGLGGGDRVRVDGSFSGSVESTSSADTLVFGSYSNVSSSVFAMGDGNDSLVFGAVLADTLIDLGAGDDTIVFGAYSAMLETTLDLSGGGADQIYLATDLARDDFGYQNLDKFVITGADDNDVLWVGSSTLSKYGYNSGEGVWTQRDIATGATLDDTLHFG